MLIVVSSYWLLECSIVAIGGELKSSIPQPQHVYQMYVWYIIM
jgi:hypothetical protein